jgi:hypothetical protein
VAAVKLLPLLSASTHLISAYKIVAAAVDDVEMRMEPAKRLVQLVDN